MKGYSMTTSHAWRLPRLFPLLTLAWLGHSPLPATAAPRTNVIVILCDDLGFGDVSTYGNDKFKTPNIDKLAASGARLTHFHTPFPYCAPTRISLQTGRYPFRTGLVSNPFPEQGVNDLGIPDSEVTIGQLFQKAGYRTCLIGKWHLGHKPQFYPTRHGYDEYLGILYSNDMRPVQLFEDEKVIEYPVVQCTLTRRYTERAVQFIEKNAQKGFFLELAHAMPHKPLAPSEAFYGKSGKGLYGDVMAELDWSVGQIMQAVQKTGIADNTLIWFTSDNGPWYGGSTGGLRGMKGRGFEGGTRVPLIAVWPGHIPAGHKHDGLGITMDIFATSLIAAGLSVPSDRPIDGKDIMPMLTSDAASPHDVIYTMGGNNLVRVRSGPWTLIVHPQPHDAPWDPRKKWKDPNSPDGVRMLAPYEQPTPVEYPGMMTGDFVDQPSLFNVDEDPTEQHNVAGQHREVVAKLTQLADKIRAEMPPESPRKRASAPSRHD